MDGLENNVIYCEGAPERHLCGVAGGGREKSEDDAAPGDAVGRDTLVPIAEVRRRTGLTRKALLVYEELGLVAGCAAGRHLQLAGVAE